MLKIGKDWDSSTNIMFGGIANTIVMYAKKIAIERPKEDFIVFVVSLAVCSSWI